MTDFSTEFRELVKDALSHLYDVGHLQTHPLSESMRIPADRMVAGGKARALRQILFDAIEALNTNETGGLQGRNNRSYKLLHHRYIEGTKAQEVALLLSLSDRQYFRELDKAIEELSQVLWSHNASPQFNALPLALDPAEEPTTVASEALRLSQQEKERWFDLWEVIQGLVDDLHAVLDERQTTILFKTGVGSDASQRIPIFTSRTLLRQLLLYLFLEVTGQAPAGCIEIRCAEEPDAVTISLAYANPEPSLLEIAARLQDSSEFTGLLEVINARLVVSPAADASIAISIPTSRWNVLIVDDNASTLRLFRRFLANENCRIFDASSVAKTVQFLRQTAVTIHLIIMDVMMPDQDGWEGLQKLRAHPSSQDIPVVICSVLNQPNLALSLGAAGFLAKPVEQNDLVEVVHQFLYDH
ncbi:MAG: response regulator [Anaerolineaceae bacterium]|nr:response regulator [Anaerolineaceae bacterium]